MSSYKKTTLERIEFEPLKITNPGLPLVVDDWTLAFRLGFTGRALWYTYHCRDKQYKVFKVKKASGGLRTIHNPSKVMRLMHKQIRVRILLPLVKQLGPHVAAYQQGKGTRDAVNRHLLPCRVCSNLDQPHTCTSVLVDQGKSYKVERLHTADCAACGVIEKHDCPRRGVKIHMDLKDFFLSTNRSWIRKYFHEVVGYNHYSSSLLAHILTAMWEDREKNKRNGVPQGAGTSGDICNLVADWLLDQTILRELPDWKYSRYADDLYFSHPKNLPKEEVDAVVQKVEAIIRRSGYRVNKRKLRIQRPHRRQKLLGIVLNQKANIPREEYRKFRSLLHNCISHGFNSQAERAGKENGLQLQTWISGKLAYFQAVAPHKAEQLRVLFAYAKQKHDRPPEFIDGFFKDSA